MPDTTAIPLTDAMGHWHEFYNLLGTASATLVGLLFVAATVAGGVFSSDRRAPSRLFLSASVVNFSSILAVCLVVLVPVEGWVSFGVLIMGCALLGLAHALLALVDSVRDGLFKRMDYEDRTWYLGLPIVGYLCEAGSGVTLILQYGQAPTALAVSMGLLLLVGVHNAWDITVWTVTRGRE